MFEGLRIIYQNKYRVEQCWSYGKYVFVRVEMLTNFEDEDYLKGLGWTVFPQELLMDLWVWGYKSTW